MNKFDIIINLYFNVVYNNIIFRINCNLNSLILLYNSSCIYISLDIFIYKYYSSKKINIKYSTTLKLLIKCNIK